MASYYLNLITKKEFHLIRIKNAKKNENDRPKIQSFFIRAINDDETKRSLAIASRLLKKSFFQKKNCVLPYWQTKIYNMSVYKCRYKLEKEGKNVIS